MLKSLHHAGAKLEMMLPYKIVNNNKRVVRLMSVQYYFHTSLLWPVLLYNMTIDVVTWRIIKKWWIWSLHLRNFFWLSVFTLFLLKLRGSSQNFLNFIYIYIKLKLGTKTYLPEVSVSSIMGMRDAQPLNGG